MRYSLTSMDVSAPRSGQGESCPLALVSDGLADPSGADSAPTCSTRIIGNEERPVHRIEQSRVYTGGAASYGLLEAKIKESATPLLRWAVPLRGVAPWQS